jgi:hypothetical protein
VIVFGVIIFFLVRGARKTATAFATQPAQQGEEYLSAVSLRPWDDSAWADLSCWWDGWWRNITRPGRQEGYTQAVVKSLKNPGAHGWLAYTLTRHQVRIGTLTLKSSDWRIELRISALSIQDRDVQVQVWRDGTQVATIAVTFPTCAYRTTDGATEAQWNARNRGAIVRVQGIRMTSNDPEYNDVTVNGRRIAAVADTWVRAPRPQNTTPFNPAVKSLADDLNSEEQQALYCALGMALYYDNLRNREGFQYDW